MLTPRQTDQFTFDTLPFDVLERILRCCDNPDWVVATCRSLWDIYVCCGIKRAYADPKLRAKLFLDKGRHYRVPCSCCRKDNVLFFSRDSCNNDTWHLFAPVMSRGRSMVDSPLGWEHGLVKVLTPRNGACTSFKAFAHVMSNLRWCRDCVKHASGPPLLTIQMSYAGYEYVGWEPISGAWICDGCSTFRCHEGCRIQRDSNISGSDSDISEPLKLQSPRTLTSWNRCEGCYTIRCAPCSEQRAFRKCFYVNVNSETSLGTVTPPLYLCGSCDVCTLCGDRAERLHRHMHFATSTVNTNDCDGEISPWQYSSGYGVVLACENCMSCDKSTGEEVCRLCAVGTCVECGALGKSSTKCSKCFEVRCKDHKGEVHKCVGNLNDAWGSCQNVVCDRCVGGEEVDRMVFVAPKCADCENIDH